MLAALLLPLRLLIEETEAFQVLIEAHSAGCEFYHVLAVALTELLVLLGLEDGQLLLLDPLGIELSLPGSSLLLVYVGHIHALALVVLLQSKSLWLFWFLLGRRLSLLVLGRLRLGLALGSFLDIFVLIELVLQVPHISPSAALLARLITE